MLKTLRLTVDSVSAFIGPTALSFFAQFSQGLAYLACFFLLASVLDGQFSDMELTLYSALLLLAVISFYCTFYAFSSLSLKQGYALAAALRDKLAKHMKTLPLASFRKHDTATLSGNFLHDMMETELVYSTYIYDIVATASIIVIFGGAFLGVDTTLGLVVLGTSLAAFPVLLYSIRQVERDSKTMVQGRALADKTLLEYLNGIGELKATGMTGTRFTPWVKANDRYKTFNLAAEIRFGKLGYCYLALLEFSFVITMLAAAYLYIESSISLTVFLFFMLLCGRYYEPMLEISMLLSEVRYCFASVKRIASTLDEKPLPYAPGFAEPRSHEVSFDSVHFAYGEREVLHDISFTMPEGTVTALVGESGSGKTTTANLLLRFMDVCSGSIRIGGTDVRTFAQEDLYKRFSVVFQDVYLFNDTIMNNIRIAKPSATDEEVIEAAKQSCCHEFIMELERQYETCAGEKGARLSGGERQRIAIARAILKDAPLLILDEATASVDPQNELQIQQGLTNLTRGKTLLVIAHRLSTIQKAHQILVLKSGAVAERGTHTELLAQQGIYDNLWKQQNELRSWTLT
ncbi:ATP-binding cassette domain-containing protein [Pseudodesulfovibrio sp. F-1]|uniref:ATP-binding cassette domain-containing protein n=1 Tax=Pseudodesulfovibrio alkaliphilus TaxID=2661613 RepID=A0A7K1KQX4_9BACT|nr:ABC transporter ATP-binding protein [Pseudodesulfovibrio alkaliphilus]MUM78477.1 ATP-binding cassette domain-containing protein [Pseudodesulfovibrio alkaliphilus]